MVTRTHFLASSVVPTIVLKSVSDDSILQTPGRGGGGALFPASLGVHAHRLVSSRAGLFLIECRAS